MIKKFKIILLLLLVILAPLGVILGIHYQIRNSNNAISPTITIATPTNSTYYRARQLLNVTTGSNTTNIDRVWYN